MKYQLSSRKPAVITGKTLPTRPLTKGIKAYRRPNPNGPGKKSGILPGMMRTRPLRVRVGTL